MHTSMVIWILLGQAFADAAQQTEALLATPEVPHLPRAVSGRSLAWSCISFKMDTKITDFRCILDLTSAPEGSVENMVHKAFGGLTVFCLSILGAIIDWTFACVASACEWTVTAFQDTWRVCKGILEPLWGVLNMWYVISAGSIVFFIVFCLVGLRLCCPPADGTGGSGEFGCWAFCCGGLLALYCVPFVLFMMLTALALGIMIAFVMIFCAGIVVVVLLALVLGLPALGIAGVVALVAMLGGTLVLSALIALCFALGWLACSAMLILVLLLMLGMVHGSLRATKKGTSRRPARWCSFGKQSVLLLLNLQLTTFLLLWDLNVLFVMWSTFTELANFIPFNVDLESFSLLLRKAGLESLVDFFRSAAKFFSVLTVLPNMLKTWLTFQCSFLPRVSAAGMLLAGLGALALFQLSSVTPALAGLVAHSEGFPLHKLATKALLAGTSKLIETVIVAGSGTYLLMFQNPFAGCSAYGDAVTSALGVGVAWPVGLFSLYILPAVVSSAEALRRKRPRSEWCCMLSITLGVWNTAAQETVGMAAGTPRARKVAYTQVSSVMVSAGYHMLPLGKVLATLTDCSNKGLVCGIQDMEGKGVTRAAAVAEKALAVARWGCMQPIPLLPAGSDAQLALLIACVSLITMEEVISLFKGSKDVEADTLDDAENVARIMSMARERCASALLHALRECLRMAGRSLRALCTALCECLRAVPLFCAVLAKCLQIATRAAYAKEVMGAFSDRRPPDLHVAGAVIGASSDAASAAGKSPGPDAASTGPATSASISGAVSAEGTCTCPGPEAETGDPLSSSGAVSAEGTGAARSAESSRAILSATPLRCSL